MSEPSYSVKGDLEEVVIIEEREEDITLGFEISLPLTEWEKLSAFRLHNLLGPVTLAAAREE